MSFNNEPESVSWEMIIHRMFSVTFNKMLQNLYYNTTLKVVDVIRITSKAKNRTNMPHAKLLWTVIIDCRFDIGRILISLHDELIGDWLTSVIIYWFVDSSIYWQYIDLIDNIVIYWQYSYLLASVSVITDWSELLLIFWMLWPNVFQ